jgi:hypothetical protein
MIVSSNPDLPSSAMPNEFGLFGFIGRNKKIFYSFFKGTLIIGGIFILQNQDGSTCQPAILIAADDGAIRAADPSKANEFDKDVKKLKGPALLECIRRKKGAISESLMIVLFS